MNRLEAFGYVNYELERLDQSEESMTAESWAVIAEELVNECKQSIEESKWVNLKKTAVRLSAHAFKLVEQFANERDD